MSPGKGGWQSGDGSGPWGKPPGGNAGPGPREGRTPPPDKNGPDLDEMLRRAEERFRRFFSGRNGDFNEKKGALILALVIAALWLASGIYIVRSDEQGVVLRFGKFHRVTEPGPNYHLPYPIESVDTPKVTAINRTQIGVGTERAGKAGSSSIAAESLMLTGDENIVDINFEAQWKIADAEKYLFNVRDPEQTVKDIAESAMREVVGRSPIASALNQNKLQISLDAKNLIQETLDNYSAGIEVVSVNMLKADPPSQVIDAFRDVQAAKADRERARNEAEAYRNDILPRARGEAEKMIQDAEAYREQIVSQAKGDASRFTSIYNEYAQAKDVTRKRMYLETMEQVMEGMQKVIVDDKAGRSQGVLPYLPLPEIKARGGEGAKP